MSADFDAETGEIIEAPRTTMDPMPPMIAAAILAVKAGVAQLDFDEKNEHGKYSYASVDKFYTSIRPLEAEAGIFWLLDESSFDIRAGDSGKGWVFIRYEAWVTHKSGVMWGPLRRNIAAPATGPQTFGALESYCRKALARGLYMVPTGEKDGDDVAPRNDAPVMKATRATPATKPQSNNVDVARAVYARIASEIKNAVYVEQLNQRGIYGPSTEHDEQTIRAIENGDAVWQRLIDLDVKRRYELTQTEGMEVGI